MKIFRRFYVLPLYRARTLGHVITILSPWAREVLYEGSPFLRQVSSYYLRRLGSSSAPRFFKSVIANEILRLNEHEDLVAGLLLAVVISYRDYDPDKGNNSLVTWLSWRIPYEFSKLVAWRVFHPVGPFEESFIPSQLSVFDETFEVERQIGIISKDLGLDRRSRHYYLKKAKERNAASC